VVEQPGHGVLGQPVQLAVVQGEDVADGGAVLRAGPGAVAEEEGVAHGDEVGGQTRALGTQPFGAGQAQPGGAELLDPAPYQRLGSAGEFGGLGAEAVAQHLVGAAVGLGGGARGGGAGGGGRGVIADGEGGGASRLVSVR